MHLFGFIIRILSVWLAQYLFCYQKTLMPAMRNRRISKTSTTYMRNIRSILNTSNKQMLLKSCKTVAGQGPPNECKNIFNRSEKISDTMDMNFSG